MNEMIQMRKKLRLIVNKTNRDEFPIFVNSSTLSFDFDFGRLFDVVLPIDVVGVDVVVRVVDWNVDPTVSVVDLRLLVAVVVRVEQLLDALLAHGEVQLEVVGARQVVEPICVKEMKEKFLDLSNPVTLKF